MKFYTVEIEDKNVMTTHAFKSKKEAKLFIDKQDPDYFIQINLFLYEIAVNSDSIVGLLEGIGYAKYYTHLLNIKGNEE